MFLRQLLRPLRTLSLNQAKEHFPRNSGITKQCGAQRFELHTKLNHAKEKDETRDSSQGQKLGQFRAKLKLAFTCKKCSTRNEKIISKTAYEKGLVIVTCRGCQNNHLIADNLGWFAEWKGVRNIEKYLRDKGETVYSFRNNVEGYVEVMEREKVEQMEKERKGEELRHKCEDG